MFNLMLEKSLILKMFDSMLKRNLISKKYKRVGRLNIECQDNIYKNLLIAVVDISGSMSGTPINQCKYSLQRFVDFTYKYDHLVTAIITYNDRATNFIIDKSNNYEIYGNKVNDLTVIQLNHNRRYL